MRIAVKIGTWIALAAAMIWMMPTKPAMAAKILVEDSRCSQLDAASLSTLEKQLKDGKAIAADDTIECKVPPGTKATQKNFPLTTLLPAFKTLFCRQKNSDVLEACAKVTEKTVRARCEASEKSRFRDARKSC